MPRYRARARISVPAGLGTVEDFRYLRTQTDRPVKATVPGPITLSIHVQTRPGNAYDNDRLALTWDLVPAVHAEMLALVAAGADYIQVDEPSAAIVPGQIAEYVKTFNACVEGVAAKIALHVCFGNLMSRPRGRRSYRWMFPALLDTRCHQFVFEYANREMAEIELWKEIGVDREVACGVVDVKSFHMESPEKDFSSEGLAQAHHTRLVEQGGARKFGFCLGMKGVGSHPSRRRSRSKTSSPAMG